MDLFSKEQTKLDVIRCLPSPYELLQIKAYAKACFSNSTHSQCLGWARLSWNCLGRLCHSLHPRVTSLGTIKRIYVFCINNRNRACPQIAMKHQWRWILPALALFHRHAVTCGTTRWQHKCKRHISKGQLASRVPDCVLIGSSVLDNVCYWAFWPLGWEARDGGTHLICTLLCAYYPWRGSISTFANDTHTHTHTHTHRQTHQLIGCCSASLDYYTHTQRERERNTCRLKSLLWFTLQLTSHTRTHTHTYIHSHIPWVVLHSQLIRLCVNES